MGKKLHKVPNTELYGGRPSLIFTMALLWIKEASYIAIKLFLVRWGFLGDMKHRFNAGSYTVRGGTFPNVNLSWQRQLNSVFPVAFIRGSLGHLPSSKDLLLFSFKVYNIPLVGMVS